LYASSASQGVFGLPTAKRELAENDTLYFIMTNTGLPKMFKGSIGITFYYDIFPKNTSAIDVCSAVLNAMDDDTVIREVAVMRMGHFTSPAMTERPDAQEVHVGQFKVDFGMGWTCRSATSPRHAHFDTKEGAERAAFIEAGNAKLGVEQMDRLNEYPLG